MPTARIMRSTSLSEFVKGFKDIPDLGELDELNLDYYSDVYSYAYNEAIDEGLSKDEAEERAIKAEDLARRELVSKHESAIWSMLNRVLENAWSGDITDDWANDKLILEGTDEQWRDLLRYLLQTAEGYGFIGPIESIEQYVEEGETVPDAAMRLLHWIHVAHEVWGDFSPSYIYGIYMG